MSIVRSTPCSKLKSDQCICSFIRIQSLITDKQTDNDSYYSVLHSAKPAVRVGKDGQTDATEYIISQFCDPTWSIIIFLWLKFGALWSGNRMGSQGIELELVNLGGNLS